MSVHGNRNDYFIVRQGLAKAGGEGIDKPSGSQLLSSSEAAPVEPTFRFDWIANQTSQSYPSADLVDQALISLGSCMNNPTACHNEPPQTETRDSEIPSGYTYLGQFLAHEITFDRDPTLTPLSFRSPEIDLDSLYGAGPQHNPQFFNDHARLRIGPTHKIPDLNREFENDLPRSTGDQEPVGTAVISDPRNDENLIVAQTHVAMILFHNRVVDSLAQSCPPGELFERARAEVVKYFQWIILNDYLPRLIGKERLTQVLSDGLRGYSFAPGEDLFIPFEFSVAAFRVGHSMVRNRYLWNCFHPAVVPLSLFEQTRFSGLLPRLTSDWVIDWRHFYDFREFDYPQTTINMAKKIDTEFSFHLESIPHYPHKTTDVRLRALAVRNLRRAFELKLPTGEEMAEHLQLNHDEILTDAHFKSGKQGHLFQDSILKGKTPLWYYILRESELEAENGNSYLGPIGGRIVAGTIIEIIRNSRYSIIRDEQWRPTFGRMTTAGVRRFEMVDLLQSANVVAPIAQFQQSCW